jgi:hypothetical protein
MYELLQLTKHYQPLLWAVLDQQGQIGGTVLGIIQKEKSGLIGYFSSKAIVWGALGK